MIRGIAHVSFSIPIPIPLPFHLFPHHPFTVTLSDADVPSLFLSLI
jgi:hypothetical protein